MLKGLQVHTDPLAADMYEGIDFKGDFLKQRVTRRLVIEEQYFPSAVIDRGSIRAWGQMGSPDAYTRAHSQVQDLLAAYQPPDLPAEEVAELQAMVERLAWEAGMDKLPQIDR
jgi:trimethylamine:corrinoid methyltransferase-like protein